ncbi:MAG TPA: 5-dehydro-4-deoxy-D-glucuronate isomerase [Phycisphaerales bacterium]|nr:5-dehydro-4-deoxy-D-glucuronate isomerase [Phycisphaerales bacterium]
MEVRYTPAPESFCRMTTQEVRDKFLIETLFSADAITMVYCDVDRAIAGSAVPVSQPLTLASAPQLRADYFCQRRELGVLNIGQAGTIAVDGKSFKLAPLDGLYIGRDSKEIVFTSDDPKSPARFYLLSYPAHKAYPTAHISKDQAAPTHLGSDVECNKRTIYKYIHPDGVKSCQLVMGFTQLAEGSVWNTMPPHTHDRRMEIYLYFNVAEDARVFHLMGKPDETRHIVVADRQAIISPSWSLHSGVGTKSYAFCWGMGGENQAFDDMDHLKISDLK